MTTKRITPQLFMYLLREVYEYKKYNDYALTISLLGKKLGSTYDYVSKIIRQFEKSGIVKIKRKGIEKHIKLTNVGIELAYYATKFIDVLENRVFEELEKNNKEEKEDDNYIYSFEGVKGAE